MKALLIPVIVLFSFSLRAQEIAVIDSVHATAIMNARQSLTDYYLNNDRQNVAETMQYLGRELESDTFLALYPEEKWLLWIYLEDYDSLFSGVRNYDKRNVNKIAPEPDILYSQLLAKTSIYRDSILKQVGAHLWKEGVNRDFMPLLLDYCFLGTEYETQKQEQLNVSSAKYMSAYPQSTFNPFIKKYVQFILLKKDWSFGADFGASLNIIDGDMHKTFSHQGGITIGFDLAYRKITGFMRLNIDFGRTRDSVLFSDFKWERHRLVNNYMGEFSLGYPLKISEKLRVLPFAGIGITSLSPKNPKKTDENPDAANPYHITAFCWVGGLNFDYRLGKPSLMQTDGINYQRNTGFLRLRYSVYATQFGPSRKAYNGYIHNITIGLQGFIEWFQYLTQNE